MADDFISQEYEVAQAGASVKEGTVRDHIIGTVSSVFFLSSIVLSVIVVSFSIVFFLSDVDGSSMMQTLNAGHVWGENEIHDNVVVNRYAKAERGNIIVVFHHWPPDKGRADEYFIKRLIGLEGDKIRFERHPIPDDYPQAQIERNYIYKLVVNDVVIDEPYLDKNYWGIMTYYGDDIYKFINDNNASAIDSPVEESYGVIPFADCIVRPQNGEDFEPYILVPEGYVFFMGDNRGGYDYDKFIGYHSHDGTSFGPQPASYIKGVVADIIKEKESTSDYVLRKLWEFFSLKWIFG